MKQAEDIYTRDLFEGIETHQPKQCFIVGDEVFNMMEDAIDRANELFRESGIIFAVEAWTAH